MLAGGGVRGWLGGCGWVTGGWLNWLMLGIRWFILGLNWFTLGLNWFILGINWLRVAGCLGMAGWLAGHYTHRLPQM